MCLSDANGLSSRAALGQARGEEERELAVAKNAITWRKSAAGCQLEERVAAGEGGQGLGGGGGCKITLSAVSSQAPR